MLAAGRARGFSLVEVVLAIGVLAIAVAGVLALLPPLTREVADTSDAMTAQRLPEAVHVELERLAAGGSLAGLASRLTVAGNASTLRLVAARDGTHVQPMDTADLPPEKQYFLIELWRFPPGPLAYELATGAVLPAWARVSWPYRRPGGADGIADVETAPADRASFTFTVAVNR